MNIQPTDSFLIPDWPAPDHIRALTTTRLGGRSRGPYASLNLAMHVGDDPEAVAANRLALATALDLPAEPAWLEQVHGTGIIDLDASDGTDRRGDGAVARRPGRVCAVMTADCLPVLLTDRAGTRVAAAHAGWRGLAAGVIEAAVAALGGQGRDLLAWMGPAIGPRAFEVGSEVREAFVRQAPEAGFAFHPSGEGRWLADLYQLAGQRLRAQGVEAVSGGGECTFTDAERFYSYRRDGSTGRMATLIWIADT